MLDPFNDKCGKLLTGVLSMLSLLLDIMWAPVAFIALGKLLANILFSVCTSLHYQQLIYTAADLQNM